MNASVLAFRPPPGKWWPKAGGFRIGPLGDSDLILGVVLDVEELTMTYASAAAWAKGLRILGHRDYTLPTLREFDCLHQVVIGRLGSNRYWCCETVRGDQVHTFEVSNGPTLMDRNHKLFAAAVRRHPH